GSFYLGGWGHAKLLGSEEPPRPGQPPLGTPGYMAPELARGELHLFEPKSDLFSLGAVLYELICGAIPFPRNTSPHLLPSTPLPPRARAAPPAPANPRLPPGALRALSGAAGQAQRDQALLRGGGRLHPGCPPRPGPPKPRGDREHRDRP